MRVGGITLPVKVEKLDDLRRILDAIAHDAETLKNDIEALENTEISIRVGDT